MAETLAIEKSCQYQLPKEARFAIIIGAKQQQWGDNGDNHNGVIITTGMIPEIALFQLSE